MASTLGTCGTQLSSPAKKKAAQCAAFFFFSEHRFYGRRASSASSRDFGIRSCLLTPSHISSGQATKIEDSVPITMPIISDSAMPRSEEPPYRYSASTVRKATNEVITVRDSVWLIDAFNT